MSARFAVPNQANNVSRIFIALLAGIALAALFAPIADATPVPFPNSSIETQPQGGKNDWYFPGGSWVWDGTVAHTGTHSLQVSRTSGGATGQVFTPALPVQPSTTYTLTYWVKMQNATLSPAVELFQATSTDAQTGVRQRSWMDIQTGTRDWFQVKYRFQTMPNASYVQVRLLLWTDTTGTFWFDDFALDQGAPAILPFHPGFPLAASASPINLSSPTVADINNDGKNELLVGNNGGGIDGWDAQGKTLPGFPLWTGDRHISGQIALGDLNGDGKLEIVAGTRANNYGDRAHVFAWQANGQMVNGFPQTVDWYGQCGTEQSIVSSVALGDLDHDNHLDIIAATTNGAPTCAWPQPPFTPNLYAWHADGSPVPGAWPQAYAASAIYGAVAVGDFNSDGIVDVLTGRDHYYLHAYNGFGFPLPGFPITTFLNGNTGNFNTDIRISHPDSAPVIADLDGDGQNEYIVVSNVIDPATHAIINSGVLVIEPNGARRAGWETAALGAGILANTFLPLKAPALADLDGDNKLEIVAATFDGWIRAYKDNRQLLWAFNFAQGNKMFASEPVLGDINGDGELEIVFGTYDPVNGDAPVGLFALNANGALVPGFPLWVGTPGIMGAPTLADLDKDGKLEILAADRNGMIWVWDTGAAYNPAQLPWAMGRHDWQRSASLAKSVPLPVGNILAYLPMILKNR